jgi:hypothetical protein
MGQINFVRDLIGENLSLGAQFGLNWKDWNFRGSNLILQSQLVQIRGKIARKSKFWGQLRVKLKKFTVKDHFEKKYRTLKTQWSQLIEIMGKIEKNWKFNGQLRINLHKFKIKDQSEKALKSRAGIEVRQG